MNIETEFEGYVVLSVFNEEMDEISRFNLEWFDMKPNFELSKFYSLEKTIKILEHITPSNGTNTKNIKLFLEALGSVKRHMCMFNKVNSKSSYVYENNGK